MSGRVAGSRRRRGEGVAVSPGVGLRATATAGRPSRGGGVSSGSRGAAPGVLRDSLRRGAGSRPHVSWGSGPPGARTLATSLRELSPASPGSHSRLSQPRSGHSFGEPADDTGPGAAGGGKPSHLLTRSDRSAGPLQVGRAPAAGASATLPFPLSAGVGSPDPRPHGAPVRLDWEVRLAATGPSPAILETRLCQPVSPGEEGLSHIGRDSSGLSAP